MNPLLKTVSATATNFLRTDHAAVAAAFRPYSADLGPGVKRRLAEAICRVLVNHTRLEEEIFYPAVEEIDPDMVEKSIPEHAEVARLIALLRRTEPTDPTFDAIFMELKRKVMEHVAEEERTLLPDVDERLDPDRNAELGARMSGRRVELISPTAGSLLQQVGFAMPSKVLLASAGAAILAGWLASRSGSRRRLSRGAARRSPER